MPSELFASAYGILIRATIKSYSSESITVQLEQYKSNQLNKFDLINEESHVIRTKCRVQQAELSLNDQSKQNGYLIISASYSAKSASLDALAFRFDHDIQLFRFDQDTTTSLATFSLSNESIILGIRSTSGFILNTSIEQDDITQLTLRIGRYSTQKQPGYISASVRLETQKLVSHQVLKCMQIDQDQSSSPAMSNLKLILFLKLVKTGSVAMIRAFMAELNENKCSLIEIECESLLGPLVNINTQSTRSIKNFAEHDYLNVTERLYSFADFNTDSESFDLAALITTNVELIFTGDKKFKLRGQCVLLLNTSSKSYILEIINGTIVSKLPRDAVYDSIKLIDNQYLIASCNKSHDIFTIQPRVQLQQSYINLSDIVADYFSTDDSSLQWCLMSNWPDYDLISSLNGDTLEKKIDHELSSFDFDEPMDKSFGTLVQDKPVKSDCLLEVNNFLQAKYRVSDSVMSDLMSETKQKLSLINLVTSDRAQCVDQLPKLVNFHQRNSIEAESKCKQDSTAKFSIERIISVIENQKVFVNIQLRNQGSKIDVNELDCLVFVRDSICAASSFATKMIKIEQDLLDVLNKAAVDDLAKFESIFFNDLKPNEAIEKGQTLLACVDITDECPGVFQSAFGELTLDLVLCKSDEFKQRFSAIKINLFELASDSKWISIFDTIVHSECSRLELNIHSVPKSTLSRLLVKKMEFMSFGDQIFYSSSNSRVFGLLCLLGEVSGCLELKLVGLSNQVGLFLFMLEKSMRSENLANYSILINSKSRTTQFMGSLENEVNYLNEICSGSVIDSRSDMLKKLKDNEEDCDRAFRMLIFNN